MFIPANKDEMKKRGWDAPDVVLVTGDAYIDSSFVGAAVIGKVLIDKGYRVGIISQPDITGPQDIMRLGEPRLFWGVTSGCVDSMVANYTAVKKPRRQDDFTPGGVNNKRPDRALIAYVNLIRRFFKNTKPIVLGGIEASLRRTAHYDYWDDSVRRSILLDAKADILVYGMGEKAALDLAFKLKHNEDWQGTRGICYIKKPQNNGEFADKVALPSYESVRTDKAAFSTMFKLFYENNDPVSAKGLYQEYDGGRFLIQNKPAEPLTSGEIDHIYELDYEREVHPLDRALGEVRALETIKFSITTHRGCYGECNFCAIAVHQGRTILNRSEASILREASKMAARADFKGYILDVGGPTANMYGIECEKKLKYGACLDKRCIGDKVCSSLHVDHAKQVHLLKKLRELPGLKKAFVASGVRYDMLLSDGKSGADYLTELVGHHVSGQMKVAPEHSEPSVLKRMGKPDNGALVEFKKRFDEENRKAGKKQFLTYYFIAAHPGCSIKEMEKLEHFVEKELRLSPEQVQIYMPTPSTYSTLMYYTEEDPMTHEKIAVEKDMRKKELQKEIVTGRSPKSRPGNTGNKRGK